MRTILISMLLMAGSISAHAQVKLQPLFTNNMVLQQQANVPIWGEDKAGKKVTVVTSWDNKKYTTTTTAEGKWKVKVTTPGAGGPYSITINDGKTVRLNNVLIGEVWLCSGQSNMEMPIVGWGNEYFKEEHKDADNHPNIRLLQLDLVANAIFQHETTGGRYAITLHWLPFRPQPTSLDVTLRSTLTCPSD